MQTMSASSSGTVQLALFEPQPAAGATAGPPGFDYEADWLDAADEAAAIALVRALPFANARYKGYTARRRVVSYGGRYDFDANVLRETTPIVDALLPLRDRAARWAGLAPESIAHALVAEYSQGAPLGWHRDVPDFEVVIGISLGHPATLRFRPYAHDARGPRSPRDVVKRVVEPRSIYAMRGAARWAWQHSVAPVAELRWSITFRTRRETEPRAAGVVTTTRERRP